MICLHIGLPKTGSTYIQHQIFPKCTGISYMNRSYSEEKKALANKLIVSPRLPSIEDKKKAAEEIVSEIKRQFGSGGYENSLVISDENISIRSTEIWRGGPSGNPNQVLNFLKRVSGLLDGSFGNFKVLIGVREQSSWLASRYAESARYLNNPSQYDFEVKVLKLLENRSALTSFRWLYYDAVFNDAVKKFGYGNVLMYSMEAMKANPLSVIQEISDFLETNTVMDYYLRKRDELGSRKSNVKSLSSNTWKMSASSDVIELKEWIKNEVTDCFSLTNSRMSNELKNFF